jgi:diguanylate cyclase (GGDEF)-like protein
VDSLNKVSKVSQDLISRYKKSFRLKYLNKDMESKYRDMQEGSNSSVLAFAVLFVLALAFAYLESKAFGHEVPIPMYGYIAATLFALVNLLISHMAEDSSSHNMRLLSNGFFLMGCVIAAVFLQKYSAYHVIEFILLVVWLGSLKSVRMPVTSTINIVMSVAFVATMYATDISSFWIILVAILLGCAVVVGAYLGYFIERERRMLFLQTENNKSMISRQETWGFTLIDLDIALSGILNFKEMIGLLKKHLEPVIEFDSYILTALEGQGPKPVADKIEGELFEDDENTLWPEDLLSKLTQTRQATTSSEHETVKGFLGMEKQRFISYRLDVPVFSDSKLLGIISLRRNSEPFDDLDMIASMSIAAQAMLIFRRTAKNSAVVLDHSGPDPVIRPKKDHGNTTKISSTDSKDMDITDMSHQPGDAEVTLVPQDVITKFKKEEASAKKTITLMSRENADKVAVDRYRTAAVEGDPLSVLVIEVDGLSKLREQDGDQVAYKVFAAIVKYIFSKVEKEKDILGRYGQNGLSVLMPRVDMNAAEKFAEMIRQFVSSARYKTAYGEKSATLSIGVAAITDDTGDYASMVKRADMALFVAKKNGRNCVKVRL